MSFLTPGRYIEEKSPLRLQLEKPNDFFTDEEYDLLYCLVYKNVEKKVEGADKQGITQELKISDSEVGTLKMLLKNLVAPAGLEPATKRL